MVIIGFTQYNKIYYSLYVDGNGFKTSSIEEKFQLLNNNDFRENSSSSTFEKAVMILTEDVIAQGSAEDKIDLLDNSDFIHYAADDSRKRLIESIVDTKDISRNSFNRFLFKVCRSTDFKIVADRIVEKRLALDANVISDISSNLNYISKSDEEKRKWENIIQKNAEVLKQLSVDKAIKVIESSYFDEKVDFVKSIEYSKYLAPEMKEKVIDSILLSAANSEEKLMRFLFKDCSYEQFEFAGERLEKQDFYKLNAKTVHNLKNEINNKFYNSKVWQRIIEKYSAEKQKKIDESAKPVIEKEDFAEKLNLYSSPDFLYYASDETKIKLIDSMSNMSNITRMRFVDFLFDTCSKDEFDFFTKRIAETGCNWEYSVITEISNKLRRNDKGLNTSYWNSVVKNYRILREKKIKEIFEKIKGEKTSVKDKIELAKSKDFSYAPFEVRKELALLTATSAINEGTVDDRISVFTTGNTKYTPEDVRRKLLDSIVNDPNVNDDQLRDVFIVCKGEECKIAFNKMVERKTPLPPKYLSRLIDIELFKMVDKESILILVKDNPVTKRQLVVYAREMLQYKNYGKLLQFTNSFDEILKINSSDSLYKDIVYLKENGLNMAFRPNRKSDYSEEKKDVSIVKGRVLEHLNKVITEYDEEIKNSSNLKEIETDTNPEKNTKKDYEVINGVPIRVINPDK